MKKTPFAEFRKDEELQMRIDAKTKEAERVFEGLNKWG